MIGWFSSRVIAPPLEKRRRSAPVKRNGIDTLTTITCQYRWPAHNHSQQNQSLAIVAANPKRLPKRLYWVNVSMPQCVNSPTIISHLSPSSWISRGLLRRLSLSRFPTRVIVRRTICSVWATYVASTKGLLTLHFLPDYAPELNPDELVWSHMKRTGVARAPLRKGDRLSDKVEEQLASIKRMPQLVRSFFKAPTVAYINDC